jgi:selenocysteine-specific elongation factor
MIITTAGHIDHGKSALIEAMTGRRMDRLPAERRRGITLDLGFAPLPLPDGSIAGVIDVPGHEDLIRTMAAGASGADLALLVVAADDGIMPQTEEHLLVLEHLGVPVGIPVLSKCDLVAADWLELVREEVARRLAGSSIRFGVPVPVSALTGEGLGKLAAAIGSLAGQGRQRARDDLFRLPVDRAFTLGGTGTVVTGTAASGSVAVGTEVRILPGEGRGRVRSIESHGIGVDHSLPGERTALAIAGIARDAVGRGSVVVSADAPWEMSERGDVELAIAPGSAACVRRTRVLLHVGTAESPAWVVPRSPIAPGSSGFARVVLERPVLLRGGDRFVIRSASPARPVGGGWVVDPRPPQRAPWPAELALDADPAARLHALVGRRRNGVALTELPQLSGLAPVTVERMTRRAAGLVRIGDHVVARASVDLASARMLDALERFHRTRPADSGMPLETLRRAGVAPVWMAEAALRGAEGRGQIVVDGALARVRGFRTRVAGGDAVVSDVVRRIEGAGLAPPTAAELAMATGRDEMPAILRVAAAAGQIVPVERDRYFARKALEEFEAALRELGREGAIGVADVRNRLGLSRKYLIPLLEWADREGVTVRIGDTRQLRSTDST